jgi:hypothetical protein
MDCHDGLVVGQRRIVQFVRAMEPGQAVDFELAKSDAFYCICGDPRPTRENMSGHGKRRRRSKGRRVGTDDCRPMRVDWSRLLSLLIPCCEGLGDRCLDHRSNILKEGFAAVYRLNSGAA